MNARLPMMMYGSYNSYRTNKETGKREKYRVTHDEKAGDTGFFPSVNHIYMNTGSGGKKLTKPAEALKTKWKEILSSACKKQGWVVSSKEKIIVDCWFYFPDHRTRDTNNIFKLLMDSMEGIVFEDDYYALPRVQDFEVLEKGKEKAYIEVKITKAGGNGE